MKRRRNKSKYAHLMNPAKKDTAGYKIFESIQKPFVPHSIVMTSKNRKRGKGEFSIRREMDHY